MEFIKWEDLVDVRLLGIILTSIGFGMILVIVIPYWLGYILAFGLFICGLCLIFINK